MTPKYMVHIPPTLAFNSLQGLAQDVFLPPAEGLPRGYWNEEGKTRHFFDNLARAHNFDPLIPDNWYKVSHKDIAGITVIIVSYLVHANFGQDAQALLSFYQGSFVKALLDAYPDLGLDQNKFVHMSTLPLACSHCLSDNRELLEFAEYPKRFL